MTNDLTFIAVYIDSKLFSTSTCLRKFILFRVLFTVILIAQNSVNIIINVYGNPKLFRR